MLSNFSSLLREYKQQGFSELIRNLLLPIKVVVVAFLVINMLDNDTGHYYLLLTGFC